MEICISDPRLRSGIKPFIKPARRSRLGCPDERSSRFRQANAALVVPGAGRLISLQAREGLPRAAAEMPGDCGPFLSNGLLHARSRRARDGSPGNRAYYGVRRLSRFHAFGDGPYIEDDGNYRMAFGRLRFLRGSSSSNTPAVVLSVLCKRCLVILAKLKFDFHSLVAANAF